MSLLAQLKSYLNPKYNIGGKVIFNEPLNGYKEKK